MTTFYVSTKGLPQLHSRFDDVVTEDWLGERLTVVFRPQPPSSRGVLLSERASVKISLSSGATLSFWTGSSDNDDDWIDQLRDCFSEPRRVMRRHLEHWRSFSAASEDCFSFRRGQRAAYRRKANACLADAKRYAAEWRAAKAIWRNLVSLRQGR